MIEETERVFCKVVECLVNSVVIEINLPNGEILRELDGYMFNVLKKFRLTSIGSKFYYVVTETGNGINIEIEPYIEIKDAYIQFEINSMYDELGIG